MSTKATAARIYEYGEPDVFRFETMDVPDPVGHEVLVRNTVIGLNVVDILLSPRNTAGPGVSSDHR
jgi:NADPH2:quinone reductase